MLEILISVYFEGHRRQEQEYDFKLFITNNFYGCGMVELEDLFFMICNFQYDSLKYYFMIPCLDVGDH